MGRWAQQRKRGGHVGDQPGLPAGPSLEFFEVQTAALEVFVVCDSDDEGSFLYWRSRWRIPSVTLLWTLSPDDTAVVTAGAQQESPFASVAGQQQDCEVIFTDIDGNPQSQWSGFKTITP